MAETNKDINHIQEASRMAEAKEDTPLMAGILSTSEKVARIVSQAEESQSQEGNLWDTHFYKVVLAGNVGIIKQVVAHLESAGSMQTLDWLFQRNAFELKHSKKDTNFKRLKCNRIIMYILIAVMSTILTPGFYAFHFLIGLILNIKRRQFSKYNELPLATAAFSKNPDMISFFLSQGVEVDQIDSNDNNVFHYIADLSTSAPEAAIEIFHIIIDAINDQDYVKKLVQDDRNASGLTAVAYVAKFGSPSLLSEILKQPGIMHQTAISAKTDQVVFSDRARIQNANTRLEILDVTKYEAGSITDQSTILNILSDRNVTVMSKTELRIFKDSEFIGIWLIYKCKQMLKWVMISNVCDVVITGLLLHILAMSFVGRNGVQFRQWRRNEDIKVQTAELAAWTNHSSSIFKQEVFDEMVNTKRLVLQQQWWESMRQHDAHKVKRVLAKTSLDPGETADTDDKFFANFTDADMDKMYEQALSMKGLNDTIATLDIVRLYPEILSQFGHALHQKQHHLFGSLDNVYSSKGVPPTYENFTADINGTLIVPKKAVTLGNITSLLCVDIHKTYIEQYRDVLPEHLNFTDIQNYATDSCYFQLYMNVAVKDKPCQKNGPEQLKEKLYSFHDLYHDIMMKTMTWIVIICMYLYIFIDICERGMFLTLPVSFHSSVGDMFYTTLVQKVPGSYVHKQLNIFSAFILLYQFHLHEQLHSQSQQRASMEEYYRAEGYVTMLFIVAIILRFIVHIHALRLVPSVGHFVITMFLMGTNLLHFSTVFSIVLFIFSLLFWVLIDNPECPLERLEGFQTIPESIFSTFKLTFGHGEMEPFFVGAPVKFSYVLYMIIVVLLLLNLIIAIMSSTATDIMAEPWRTVLWKIEWLDEATSVEFALSIVTLALRKMRMFKYRYSSHKAAGYIVTENPEGKYNVCIESFHCPGLENIDD